MKSPSAVKGHLSTLGKIIAPEDAIRFRKELLRALAVEVPSVNAADELRGE
ncbi:MAG: hypothetical protein OEV94_11575 [Deltaproteobacteria bacterium]|nr:hypothetical protein [Deltaproteobacteria bacterium]